MQLYGWKKLPAEKRLLATIANGLIQDVCCKILWKSLTEEDELPRKR